MTIQFMVPLYFHIGLDLLHFYGEVWRQHIQRPWQRDFCPRTWIEHSEDGNHTHGNGWGCWNLHSSSSQRSTGAQSILYWMDTQAGALSWKDVFGSLASWRLIKTWTGSSVQQSPMLELSFQHVLWRCGSIFLFC